MQFLLLFDGKTTRAHIMRNHHHLIFWKRTTVWQKHDIRAREWKVSREILQILWKSRKG